VRLVATGLRALHNGTFTGLQLLQEVSLAHTLTYHTWSS
jgi:hypothetical protein